MLKKPKRVPLKTLWRGGTKDLTTWLSKNIHLLSEELGIPLAIVPSKKSTKGLSPCIIARELDGRLVIIVSQLGKTSAEYLGKILTCFCNLNAKAAIWISSNPQKEHILAINWLGEFISEKNASFCLIKIEAIKFNGSNPFPMFSVVAGSTDIMISRKGAKIATLKIDKLKKNY